MKFLAIDPGPQYSAYVLVNQKGGVLRHGYEENERLKAVWPTADRLLVEMVASYGMPVGQEIFETCLWIGRFIEAFGKPFVKVYRKEVKLALCQSLRAKDSHVRQALLDLYGGKHHAVGNKKCPVCKGKKVVGRARLDCRVCKKTGWLYPPGPLAGIHGDQWAALAVAATYLKLGR
ncbi:MAG: hypothetical protein M0Q27_03435 [Candidatus Colwellbacteria bacterium]|nr:hypothetical protein [Candidatus Colwellbacteria bacterium]